MAKDPNWTWDETVLAFDFYMRHHPQPPGDTSAEVIALSQLLLRMARQQGIVGSVKFRNPSGVYMKLMNFRRFDPEFQESGRKGLERGAVMEELVFERYFIRPVQLAKDARFIRQAVADDDYAIPPLGDEEIEESEGAIVMALHRRRERSGKLPDAKRRQVLAAAGKLACEVCDFDFTAVYGERGAGFIEVHHNVPLASPRMARKTKLSDLACVCANCHRMLHRGGILTVSELRSTLRPAS